MIVVGAGIGGMLTASLFDNVLVFEKKKVGGRFRNLSVKGFQLTTGALHMVPHGTRGGVSKILRKVSADCRIIDSNPAATFLFDKEYTFSQVLKLFNLKEKFVITKLFAEMPLKSAPNTSIHQYISEKVKNENVLRMLDAFCGWSFSIHSWELKCSEFFEIYKKIAKYKGPGVPKGGCSGVIDSLQKVVERRGGRIIEKKVKEIVVEDSQVIGVIDEDSNEYWDNTVVSNIGAKETLKISKKKNFPKEYVERVENLKESAGMKISVASKKPLINHSGVVITPNLERIGGFNQVTNADKNLAPKGFHLVMTHQTIESNLKKEREKGLEDVETLFGDKWYEILAVQSYTGVNPVNKAMQGEDLPQKTPVKGLYLVGDDAKVSGGIEVDGIAFGVLKIYKELLNLNQNP